MIIRNVKTTDAARLQKVKQLEEWRILLQACETKAKQKGFLKIGLAASVDTADPGRRLYEKLGYQHDGKEQYVDGVYDGVKDWVIDMVKSLS